MTDRREKEQAAGVTLSSTRPRVVSKHFLQVSLTAPSICMPNVSTRLRQCPQSYAVAS